MPLTVETVTAECGAQLREGDRAYDYYGMKPGVVGEVGNDGWFLFSHDCGSRSLLNGQRICSMLFARLRGFPGADAA